MKLIKMKINNVQVKGGTHYEYPKPYYDPRKVRYGPFYEGGVKERGIDETYIVFGVEDGDALQFLEANGKSIGGFVYSVVELTREEALEFGNAHTKQSVKITDQNKVLELCAKAVLGVELTKEEKSALDPNTSDLGISKTKSFEETLDAALSKI